MVVDTKGGSSILFGAIKGVINLTTNYKNITTQEGLQATEFIVTTKKGSCSGLFVESDNKIFVHHVFAQKGLSGLMRILVNKFKTNKIQFTPLITSTLEQKVKGGVKSTISASDKSNPYEEDIEVLDCEWEI